MRELRGIIATPTRVLYEVVGDANDLDGASRCLIEVAVGPEVLADALISVQLDDDDVKVDFQVRPA